MTLWGGRFEEAAADTLWAFTVATADRRLLAVDVEGSMAHVAALVHTGVFEPALGDELLGGLEQIRDEVATGRFRFLDGDEDVHTAVERRLGELIGEPARRLHTGRSRNDQIALDMRLYLRRAARARIRQLIRFIDTLAGRAAAAGERVVASYTHLQHAQAVPLAHHLLAHAWALVRDTARFVDVLQRIEVSPLGAGAGGGSRLPLDPGFAASRLGMKAAFDNSMDAVASRDVETEYVYCCAQTFVHLSRLAEELILWGSAEFAWARYADRHTTGSSALPQKKNPDIAELVRAKAASAIGHLTGLLAVQKGLPLTYNRDLQQDKEHLFVVDDDLGLGLEALTEMLEAATIHPPLPSGEVAALDLAELLVERGVPFREAHEAVGRLVSRVLGEGRNLAAVTPEDLAAAHPSFDGADVRVLDPIESVRDRRSPGGGSFLSVAGQLDALRRRTDALADAIADQSG